MARLKPLWLALPALAERVRGAKRVLIASDYDGTLTPIVWHPDRVRLQPRTRRVLGRLSRLPGVEVAILSGRRLADVKRHIGVPGLWLSGVVGLETQSPGAMIETHVPRGRELPAELQPPLAEWCQRFDGAWVEDKRWTIAVHYRQVAPRAQAEFRAGVRRLLRPYRARVEVIDGKKVLEVVPAARWSKATALESWWNGGRSAGGLLVFLGDDENDEPVHAYVRRQRGITVAVGRRASRAEYALGSSEEVTWWLEWLAAELESASSRARAARPSRPRRRAS